MVIVYIGLEYINKDKEFLKWWKINSKEVNTTVYVKAIKIKKQYFIEVKSYFDDNVKTFQKYILKEQFFKILEEEMK
jgi:hypothetical protein